MVTGHPQPMWTHSDSKGDEQIQYGWRWSMIFLIVYLVSDGSQLTQTCNQYNLCGVISNHDSWMSNVWQYNLIAVCTLRVWLRRTLVIVKQNNKPPYTRSYFCSNVAKKHSMKTDQVVYGTQTTAYHTHVHAGLYTFYKLQKPYKYSLVKYLTQ